ncbi:MAG: hypothetical protein LIP09_09920 [Bacteroidales bacterium]|nr:hypothetical protein [Bacteroidales bacterium]
MNPNVIFSLIWTTLWLSAMGYNIWSDSAKKSGKNKTKGETISAGVKIPRLKKTKVTETGELIKEEDETIIEEPVVTPPITTDVSTVEDATITDAKQENENLPFGKTNENTQKTTETTTPDKPQTTPKKTTNSAADSVTYYNRTLNALPKTYSNQMEDYEFEDFIRIGLVPERMYNKPTPKVVRIKTPE